jgi:putative transposase
MTVSRPGVLRAGDEIRFHGRLQTVVSLSGSSVRLVDVTGAPSVVSLPRLLTDPSFAPVETARAPLPPLGGLDGLPEAIVERAHWWERHVVEVLAGLPPGAEPGSAPKPAYDPAATTLRQRELAKVAELAALEHRVGLATLQRLRRGYERQGLWGLVDRRAARQATTVDVVVGRGLVSRVSVRLRVCLNS